MLKDALTKFASLAITRTTRDDDTTDQLNHFVAVSALVATAVFAGAKQWAGDPIHCWTPKEYGDKHFQSYIDSYCFITHMYNIPMTEPIPVAIDDRRARDISFYRWVVVVFLLQAFMFKLPHLVWKTLKFYSGINMEKIVAMTLETQLLGPKERHSKLANIAIFIDQWLRTYTRFTSGRIYMVQTAVSKVLFCFGKRSGTYLVKLYLFTKVLYLVNIIGQFAVLTSFLEFNYFNYGFEVGNALATNGYWNDYEKFPRISLCDFHIRQLQNIQRFTVQCVLSVNLFLEKIYAIQWFCMMILAVLTAISLLSWLCEELFASRRERFLRVHMKMLDIEGNDSDLQLFKVFVRQYLRDDGVFLLRVVSRNTSAVLTFDLIEQLWIRYKKKNHKSDDENTSFLKISDNV